MSQMTETTSTPSPQIGNNGERELILIKISGADQRGVTSALTEILARYDAAILDIGQADIHHTLSLGILFKTDSRSSGEILKELLFKTSDLKVQVEFNIISVEGFGGICPGTEAKWRISCRAVWCLPMKIVSDVTNVFQAALC